MKEKYYRFRVVQKSQTPDFNEEKVVEYCKDTKELKLFIGEWIKNLNKTASTDLGLKVKVCVTDLFSFAKVILDKESPIPENSDAIFAHRHDYRLKIDDRDTYKRKVYDVLSPLPDDDVFIRNINKEIAETSSSIPLI